MRRYEFLHLSLISLIYFVKKHARGACLRDETYVQNPDKHLIWNLFQNSSRL